MKKSFISICFVLIVSLIILSEDVSSQELIENPSQTPLSNESTSWGNERYRLIGDMNFDGLSDLILSDALFKSGTGGVGFTVYLQDSSGLYREIGKTGGKKSTISIEKNYREIRLGLIGI